MNTASSNQQADSKSRGIASSDETSASQSFEIEPSQNPLFEHVVSYPDVAGSTYIPHGSMFERDQEEAEGHLCTIVIRKELENSGRHKYWIELLGRPEITYKGTRYRTKSGNIFGYSLYIKSPETELTELTDTEFLNYNPRSRQLESQLVPPNNLGTATSSTYWRIFFSFDPATSKPTSAYIEYRTGPQEKFKDKALQARFTCAVPAMG